MAYWKRGGHCTRCEKPFPDDETVHMVVELVSWAVCGDIAFVSSKTVAVCEECLKPKEMVHRKSVCPGCGAIMAITNPKWRGRTCSERCEQRTRRARQKKALESCQPLPTCQSCGAAFRARTGARFCSSRCRQWAY